MIICITISSIIAIISIINSIIIGIIKSISRDPSTKIGGKRRDPNPRTNKVKPKTKPLVFS